MNLRKLFIFFLPGIFLLPTAVLAQESSASRIKLQQVIQEFQAAISEKDSVKFNKLFFQNEVPFVGIMSPKTEQSIKKNVPDFEGVSVSNSRKFIREICKTDKAQKEDFYNIDIYSDGMIASIMFDYSFTSGDKMIQWGNEKWNLVNDQGEWLITDVIYSIHFPGVEEFPYGPE